MTKSYFYYPATYHKDGVSNPINIPAVEVLSFNREAQDLAVILETDNGVNSQGVYVHDGSVWRYAMPTESLNEAWINGDTIDIYVSVKARVVLPSVTIVYKNGQLLPEDVVLPDYNSVYVVRTPKVIESSGDSILRGDLSQTTGSALVGYKDGTVEAALDFVTGELAGVGDLSAAVAAAHQSEVNAGQSETNAAQSAANAESSAARAADSVQQVIDGARSAISASGSLTYNSTTGVMSYTAPLLSLVATSGKYSDLTGRPIFATVATSGLYSDLTGRPTSLSDLTNNVGFVDIQGARSAISASGSLTYNSTTGVMSYTAPVLATVATSGKYVDLIGRPTFATVATSGSYTDLVNKPVVPTLVSQLTNDLGFVTSDTVRQSISATGSISYNSTTGVISYTAPTLATVATSGSYTDLLNKPTVPTAVSQLSNDLGFVTSASVRTSISATGSISYNSTTGVISYTAPTLAAVATSGAYADLTGRPTFATVATSGLYSDLTGKPAIPTLVSQLSNDAGYLTSTGSIDTAKKLATPVNINGVPFDGSASITVADSTKEPKISSGTTLHYWRGDKSWQPLTTDSVTEGAKLYFSENGVLGTIMKNLSLLNKAAVTAADSLLTAVGKLQAQVSDKASLAGAIFTGQIFTTSQPISTSTPLGAVSGTVTLNLATAGKYSATLSSAGATFNFTNTPQAGKMQVVFLRLTNAGLGTITWPAGTLNLASLGQLTSDGVDIIGVQWDDETSKFMVHIVGKDVAK